MKIFGLIILITLAGCKCPVDIDSPKKIEPLDNAKALFINALPQSKPFKIGTKYKDSIASAGYEDTIAAYSALGAGLENFISLIDNSGNQIYSAPAKFEKGDIFSAVFYGFVNSPKVIYSDDFIPDYKASNAYVVLFHAADLIDSVNFESPGGFPINALLGTGGASEILTVYSSTVDVIVKNNDEEELASVKEVEFEAGAIYHIVFRGGSEGRPLEIIVYKTAYPFT